MAKGKVNIFPASSLSSSASTTDGQIMFGIYERLKWNYYKPLKGATSKNSHR